MAHPHLLILSYSQAAMFLSAASASDVCALISIHGSREFGVDFSCDYRLDLNFDDVDAPIPSDPDSIQRHLSRQLWNKRNNLVETPPALSDARAIIDFAQRVKHLEKTLLCHCFAGMSRAPAAALICLTTWRGGGSEKDCLAETLRLRPGAVPHPGLIRFADELLGRGGQLIAALRHCPS